MNFFRRKIHLTLDTLHCLRFTAHHSRLLDDEFLFRLLPTLLDFALVEFPAFGAGDRDKAMVAAQIGGHHALGGATHHIHLGPEGQEVYSFRVPGKYIAHDFVDRPVFLFGLIAEIQQRRRFALRRWRSVHRSRHPRKAEIRLLLRNGGRSTPRRRESGVPDTSRPGRG